MSGKPGRSGRRRKPLADHLLAGTYRPDRHGPLPPVVPGNVVPMPADPEGVPAVLAGLGPRGRTFAEECLARYHAWTPPTLLLLHEAARIVDELEQQRGQHKEQALRRALLATLKAIDFEVPAAAPVLPPSASKWTGYIK